MARQLREVALDDVVRALRGAKSSVLLASPYLSRNVAGLLAEASRAGPVKDLRLITTLLRLEAAVGAGHRPVPRLQIEGRFRSTAIPSPLRQPLADGCGVWHSPRARA